MTYNLSGKVNGKKVYENYEGNLKLVLPLLLVFIRFFLAVLTQAFITGILFVHGSVSPWRTATNWWMVYGTLIDLGCLVTLFFITKKEGIRLFSLLNYDPKYRVNDILRGIVYFLLFFSTTMLCTLGASILLYGSPQPPSVAGKLPIMGAIYSIIIWPIIWSITEQLTYQGYCLPRIDKVIRKRILTLLLVAFGWGLQHIALPLIPDWRFMAMRFLSTFPVAIIMIGLYLPKRRLMPFIIAHWAMDFVGAFTGVFLPSIMR